MKAIDPRKIGLKEFCLTKTRNNRIKIEATEADLGKLKSSSGLQETGLEVKDESK